jgi:hypothetical protein
MHNRALCSAFFLCTVFISAAAIGEMDPASQEALVKTQQVLTNPEDRQNAFQGNESMQGVDRDVSALSGNDKNKNAIYDVASKIFADIANQANGDSIKMQELIEAAQKNPEAFLNNTVSEQNKAMIRQISEDIEKISVDSKKP